MYESQHQQHQRVAFDRNFLNIIKMTISRTEIEKLIRHIEAVLAVLKKEIAPADIPQEVLDDMQKRMDAGICLAWHHKIQPGERVTRGLCEADYSTTMARIRRGEDDEIDLMMQGKLGAKAKSGRKAARDIAASQKTAEGEMNRQRAAEPKGKYRKKDGNEAS